jgi:hypothetical protein
MLVWAWIWSLASIQSQNLEYTELCLYASYHFQILETQLYADKTFSVSPDHRLKNVRWRRTRAISACLAFLLSSTIHEIILPKILNSWLLRYEYASTKLRLPVSNVFPTPYMFGNFSHRSVSRADYTNSWKGRPNAAVLPLFTCKTEVKIRVAGGRSKTVELPCRYRKDRQWQCS